MASVKQNFQSVSLVVNCVTIENVAYAVEIIFISNNRSYFVNNFWYLKNIMFICIYFHENTHLLRSSDLLNFYFNLILVILDYTHLDNYYKS